MQKTCDSCARVYDDAKCWTYCPHDQFLSDESLAQKDLANRLCGKRLRFNHMPDGNLYIESVNWEGMVTIKGMPGEFAPHLFQVVEAQ
jgi:hypothetical protein